PADRPAQLRRALQSEHHVLCVHPADQNPDTAYEAAMIQADTKQVVFPLLPETLHPGFHRLANWIRNPHAKTDVLAPHHPLPRAVPTHHATFGTHHSALTSHHSPLTTQHASPLGMVEVERWSTGCVLLEAETPRHNPSFPCWDMLRLLGGEIVEVTALAEE